MSYCTELHLGMHAAAGQGILGHCPGRIVYSIIENTVSQTSL